MAHEVETMAYANETPWHGLGNKIDSSATIEEMLVAAGLDWSVSLRPIFIEAKDGTKINLPLRRALVRDSDNKVMTVCGDYWKPLQNKDALEFFREYTESGGATLETAGSLRGGKLIWALASIKKGFFVKGSNQRDAVKGYILLSSPHEVGQVIKVRTTATRVVCANTFAMAERDAVSYRQSHTTKFNAEAARESIQLAQDQIAKLEENANILAAKVISEYDSVRFLARLLDEVPEGESEEGFVKKLLEDPSQRSHMLDAVLDSVNNAPGAEPGTAWGLFNGVTHYADHVAGRKQDTRLYNAWFGNQAKMKQTALDKLLEMV